LPPNASLWRKSRGIARTRPYGVASPSDGYDVLNWSSSRTHQPSLLIQWSFVARRRMLWRI